jgi:hypothetical protein
MRAGWVAALALMLAGCVNKAPATHQERTTDGPPIYLAHARDSKYVVKRGTIECIGPENVDVVRAWRAWAAHDAKNASAGPVGRLGLGKPCWESHSDEWVYVDFYEDVSWGFGPPDGPMMGGINKVARIRIPLPPAMQIPQPHQLFFPMPLYGMAYVDTRDLQPARSGVPPLPQQ